MKHNIIRRALAKAGIFSMLANRSRSVFGKSACPRETGDFEFQSSINNPTKFYRSCVAYYDQCLPEHIKRHRQYFSVDKRGFGEDAFHVMWSLLVERFKPVKFLEIGVYRGQVLSLISLLQRDYGLKPKNTGIGPFERIGDSASVDDYGHCLDWIEDIRTNISHFGLSLPRLVKALSTDAIAIDAIKSSTWDMIYIDGNHDYEVVAEDWKNCIGSVRTGGIVVLDDSGLNSNYRPPPFASGGFPGPSQVANTICKRQFREILQVGHNRVFQRIE
jgi:hypothetical protein